MDKSDLKNVKIKKHIHSQIKTISESTGLNVSKLIEMGAIKIIEEFKNGEFDKLIDMQKKLRRDGTIIR